MLKKLTLPLLGMALVLGGCSTHVPTAGFSGVLPALTAHAPGNRLTYDDLQILNSVAQDNLEERVSGREDFWRNVQTRHFGSVVSFGVVYTSDGTPCRDLEQTATIRGRVARARGRACRAPNGIWGVIQSHSLPTGTVSTPPPSSGSTSVQPGGWQTLGDSLAPGGAQRPAGWEKESF